MNLGEWPTSSHPLSPLLLEGSAGSNPAEAGGLQACLEVSEEEGMCLKKNIRTRIGSSFVLNRACAVRTLRNKMATTVTRPCNLCKNTRSRIFSSYRDRAECPRTAGHLRCRMCDRHRDRAHRSLRDPRWRESGKEEIDKVHGVFEHSTRSRWTLTSTFSRYSSVGY